MQTQAGVRVPWLPPPPGPAGSQHKTRGFQVGVNTAGEPPRSEDNSANTQTGSTTPSLLQARGSFELSPWPSRLLELEIRELPVISCQPRTRPRTHRAPLSVLLTGEMSKPV